MQSFTVIGGFTVAGKHPGETVTEDELAGANIPVLIDAGCITPNKPTKGAGPNPKE